MTIHLQRDASQWPFRWAGRTECNLTDATPQDVTDQEDMDRVTCGKCKNTHRYRRWKETRR